MSAILTAEDLLLVRDIALHGLCKAGDEVVVVLQLDTNPSRSIPAGITSMMTRKIPSSEVWGTLRVPRPSQPLSTITPPPRSLSPW